MTDWIFPRVMAKLLLWQRHIPGVAKAYSRVLVLLIIPFISYSQATFTNPLLPSGADPWTLYKDGFYYYTNTLSNRIDIWKTQNIAALDQAERKTIWVPPSNTMYSRQIWAPEIHFLMGKWYVYFAADDGRNENHRLYVLENDGDPMHDEWVFKGKISDASDKWAIDGSVFYHDEQLYMVWSGWEGDTNGRQDIYIARMTDPLTISGKRVCISKPQLSWERHGDLSDPDNPAHVDVNEGPQILVHGDQIFLIYSASGCWTDQYSLGMLTADSRSNLTDASSWVKSQWPVFTQSPENDVFAPGHNSFFKSPNGKEDWILYHANDDPGQGCGKFRSPRAQRFYWRSDGTPDFAVPVKVGVELPIPR